MQPAPFDNRTVILKDDLVREACAGSVVSVDVGTVLKRLPQMRAETHHFEKKCAKEVQASRRSRALKSCSQTKAELPVLKGE